MALDGVSLIEFNNRVAESVEQDQTTRMYRLILLYTLRKINPMSGTAGDISRYAEPCTCRLLINKRC